MVGLREVGQRTAFLFHGSDDGPDFHARLKPPRRHFLQNLGRRLSSSGTRVIAPQYPTSDQSPEKWASAFTRAYQEHGMTLDDFNDDVTFIGHSVGGTFATWIVQSLAEIGQHVDSLHVVAGPFGFGHLQGHGSSIEAFVDWAKQDLDPDMVRKGVSNKLALYYSDNDPFVPVRNASALLGVCTSYTLMKQQKHFTAATTSDVPPLVHELREDGLVVPELDIRAGSGLRL
jgi:predicted alpha/beta hydrolase family esterase